MRAGLIRLFYILKRDERQQEDISLVGFEERQQPGKMGNNGYSLSNHCIPHFAVPDFH